MNPRLQKIWDHPYTAPIAFPLRAIATTATPAAKHLKEYCRRIGIAFNGIGSNPNLSGSDMLAAIFTGVNILDSDEMISAIFSSTFGGLAGAVTCLALVDAGQFLPTATVGTQIAAALGIVAASAAAGPTLVFSASVLAMGAVGCLAAIPAAIKGCIISAKYGVTGKMPGVSNGMVQAPQPWPNPPEKKIPLSSLSDHLKNMEAEERQKLLESLTNEFAEDFSTIATKYARENISLKKPITIGKPLQIRRKNV